MSSKFRVNRQLQGGYIISEALLRKCVQRVDSFVEADLPPDTAAAPTDVSITFKDGRVISSKTLDDVFSDSFIQSTKIDNIHISNSDKVHISFRRNTLPVSFVANGERSTTLTFEHDLMNELAAGKTWYNFKYYHYFAQIVYIVTFVCIVLLVSSLTVLFIGDPSALLKNVIMVLSVTFLAMLLIIIAFSDIVFDLGDGARKKKLRDAIFSSIIVVAMVGIVVNFFTNWATGLLSHTVDPSGTRHQSGEVSASKPTEIPASAPSQAFQLPDQLTDVTNQDIRKYAYLLSQILTNIGLKYIHERDHITGSTDQMAVEQLELDEKLNRDFRQKYEIDFMKLYAETARRLNMGDGQYKSFPSGRISIGAIVNAGDHLIDLVNKLP